MIFDRVMPRAPSPHGGQNTAVTRRTVWAGTLLCATLLSPGFARAGAGAQDAAPEAVPPSVDAPKAGPHAGSPRVAPGILGIPDTSAAKGPSVPEATPSTAAPGGATEVEKVEARSDAAAAQSKADSALLAALLRVEDTHKRRDRALLVAIADLAALGDARAVPQLLALSRVKRDVDVRHTALQALTRFPDAPGVRERLLEGMAKTASIREAALVLPGLLASSAPLDARVPCPEAARCGADGALVTAMLDVEAAETDKGRAAALDALTKLGDVRGVPVLWRWSRVNRPIPQAAAVRGLGHFVEVPAAHARMCELAARSGPHQAAAIAALTTRPYPKRTRTLLALRGRLPAGAQKAKVDAALEKLAPKALAAARLTEAAAASSQGGEVPPTGTPDDGMRGRLGLSAASAAVGAAGGAAVTSMLADQLDPGTGVCFGWYGCAVGALSAGAVSYFGQGDHAPTSDDLALTLSTGIWGGYMGALVPHLIYPGDKDGRHHVYAGALGALLGLGTGAAFSANTAMTATDVGEVHLATIAANAVAAGTVLTLNLESDTQAMSAALIGATLVGTTGGAWASRALDIDGLDTAHIALNTLIGGVTGLQLGLATGQFYPADRAGKALGWAPWGAGVGMLTGMVLAAADATPRAGGMGYELWAGVTGTALGLSAGLLTDHFTRPGQPNLWMPLLGAAGGVVGAATTSFFPDGVTLDTGDMLLQPLIAGFAMYHTTALLGALELDASVVGASALAAPAIASGTLVALAPHLNATPGDVLMMASTMGLAAGVSSMVMWSLQERAPQHAAMWVGVTAVGMDLGLLGGAMLANSEIEHIGWKATYLGAVTGLSTLVLALPGALLSRGTNAVHVPDVLLGSAAIGLGIGVLTMPLVNFDLAPQWGSANPGIKLGAVRVMPSIAPLQSLAGHTETPVAAGVVGSF